MARRVAVVLTALFLLFFPSSAAAQSADNVLLVLNDSSPASIQVGQYYASVRHIGERNIVHVKVADTDAIARGLYESAIEAPIAAWLGRQRLQDQILYIVLTKGLPLRVDGTGGMSGTVASVDAELTLLYRKMVGTSAVSVGRTNNPYYLGAKPLSDAGRFTRFASDIYLVTRLDGFTVDDVKKLIDRGASPSREGVVVLDQRATAGGESGDGWLAETAARLAAMNQGARAQLERTRALATSTSPVLGYFSWGSNDPANQQRQAGLTYANGAIGGMLVDADGRTFREPSPEWRPAPAGSATGGQSLIGDLIREGLTGASGHVSEPLLDAIIRPQILFPAYLSGFNLAESFYLAMPFLSWQDIVIGDPLCAPFATSPLPAEQLHKGLDRETGLPALFAERRLAALGTSNLNVTALKLLMEAQNLHAQGRSQSEVHALLARATTMEPRLTGPQLELAMAAEIRGDYDDAILRYHAILAAEPNNIAALNNLAYSLADRKDSAKDALPLAERAYELTGGTVGFVADTLGWVHYKLGTLPKAQLYIERAAKLEPKNADILIHAAVIHADLKNLPQARSFLDAALRVDPTLVERNDVKALAGRIR